MRVTSALLGLTAAALLACAEREPDLPDLDSIAQRYLVLALSLGEHDPNYVDAYYGSDSLRAAVRVGPLSIPQIRTAAESLIHILGDTLPPYEDSLLALRHAYLRAQLVAMSARARMVDGERLPFDEEAELLYDVRVPIHTEAYFDSLLARLDSLVPGRGPLAARYERFRSRVNIPDDRVDTVFRTAIQSCRARTLEHMTLPEQERFDLEYVTGTPWNAYNWYQGNYRSRIQVNLDFPIAIDRAIDLACHEGYPGHHVYNAKLEQALVRERGWMEFSLYPLFSPQSLIAEGSANLGIDMAFPAEERLAYERDTLFPLAGLDASLAERNARVREIIEQLNYARNLVARQYLNGEIDSTAAIAALQRFWLLSPDAAAKTLRFIDTYRSYVINYNLGRDLVRQYVERAGSTKDSRWAAFTALLSSPRTAGLLRQDRSARGDTTAS
jgi:hypothetical protein